MVPRMKKWAVGGALPMIAVLWTLSVVAAAPAATPGELLEKAIYTEETVGNLDEAMKLYKQVIAEADAGQEAAAQAQFRLAMCLLKKGDEPAAKAAFQKLIENYPKATELVAQARQHLPSGLRLLPAPWVSGERLILHMKLPTGLAIGLRTFEVENTRHDGQEAVRCSSRQFVSMGNADAFSEVWCDPATFAPRQSYWRHAALGEASAVYGKDSVEIHFPKAGKNVTLDFTPPVLDNEQAAEAFRRLPWAVGYKTSLTIIPILTASPLPLGIDCTAKETVTVPAGTFECYKLELSIGQTFWISADEHRYLVKFAAGVTAELASIQQIEPGVELKVAGDGFQMSIPSSWASYVPASDPAQEESSRVYLIDPRVESRSEIRVRPKAGLPENARESPTAWTEEFVDDMKELFSDFAVRDGGPIERNLGGHPATVIIADYTDDGQAKSVIGVAVIGDELAANLRMSAERSVFEKLRPEFESIVDSFQLQ